MGNVAMMYSLAEYSRQWRHLLRFFDVPFEPQYLPDSIPVYLVVNHEGRYSVKHATPLPEFEHPARATYFFGKDASDDPLIPPNGAVEVTIPTEYGLGLYAFQAGAIVLYDRMAKRWKS